MLIHVHYPDNHYDYVNDKTLHILIESGKIMRFKRSSGWVVIGFDDTRSKLRTENKNVLADTKKLIRVLYNDNRYDYVTDELLDNLLEAKRVAKFERSTGWTTVGLDPIRKARRKKETVVSV